MGTIYVSSPYTSTRRHLRLNALTIQKASLWEAFLRVQNSKVQFTVVWVNYENNPVF